MLLAELHGQIMASMPLYHFTSLANLYKILKTNKLLPHARMGHDDMRRKSISFTRDPRRSFLVNTIGEGVGLRFDRNKLASRYKIIPTVHNTAKRVSHTGKGTVTSGEQRRLSRFESEERIYDREVENVKNYITGIVIPRTGEVNKKIGSPNIMDLAMSILHMSGAFGGFRSDKRFAKDVRDYFLQVIRQLNVPIVFGGKDFSPNEVNKAIGKIYWLKKNKPEEFDKLFSEFFRVHEFRGRKEPAFAGNIHIGKGRSTYSELMGKELE